MASPSISNLVLADASLAATWTAEACGDATQPFDVTHLNSSASGLGFYDTSTRLQSFTVNAVGITAGERYGAYKMFASGPYDLSGADQALILHRKSDLQSFSRLDSASDAVNLYLFSTTSRNEYGVYELGGQGSNFGDYVSPWQAFVINGTPVSETSGFDLSTIYGVGVGFLMQSTGAYNFAVHIGQILHVDGPVSFDDGEVGDEGTLAKYKALLDEDSGSSLANLAFRRIGVGYEVMFPVSISSTVFEDSVATLSFAAEDGIGLAIDSGLYSLAVDGASVTIDSMFLLSPDDFSLTVSGASNSITNSIIVNPRDGAIDSADLAGLTISGAKDPITISTIPTSPFTITGATAGGIILAGGAGSYSALEVTLSDNATFDISLGSGGAGAYDLTSLAVASGYTLKLYNDSATNAISVSIASGITYSTATAGGSISVIAPVPTLDLDIVSGLPTTGTDIRLQIINSTAQEASAWVATTVYALGAKVLRSTGAGSESTAGLYFVATTSGTSGGTEPTWDTTVGNTTSDGSVVWTCYAILYYDANPGASTYSDTVNDGEEWASGDTYEIRVAEMDGSTSFKTYQTTGIMTASGFAVAVDMSADSVYATNAVDGSAASIEAKFSPNYASSYVVLDANIDFAATETYAYYCYLLTQSQGMYIFWGGVTAIDAGNYRINTAVLDLYFDETAGFVKQTDSARIFRDDDARPALDPTTGGDGIEINWRNPVYLAETGVSGLTGSESTQLATIDTVNSTVALLQKFLRNQQYTNPVTGKIEQMNDAGTAIEYEANIYSDDGVTPYDGTAGIVRRDRFETP